MPSLSQAPHFYSLELTKIRFIYSIRVWEPPCEDSDYEAQERASKAASIAVDASWLFSESRQAYIVS